MADNQQTTPIQNPVPTTQAHNFEPNVAGALSYFLGVVTGVVFILIEKNNKFVKFHAWQSLVLGVIYFVVNRVLLVTGILAMLTPLVALGYLGISILCMWKAYNNIEYALPYIGPFAKTQSEK